MKNFDGVLSIKIPKPENMLKCHDCKCPIIWQNGKILKHINIERYGATRIITLTKDCQCGCKKARD